MATTLLIDSLADINIVERTALAAATDAAATSLTVASTDGFTDDQPIIVGTPGIEGCQVVSVDSVDSATGLTLKDGLALPHARFEPVIGLVGGSARIYRAANVDGTAPADSSFSELVVRALDPDQQTTYYTDSEGSSSYWYKWTYYDATSSAETPLAAAVAVRGDDFGHYASLSEIRAEAGFTNAPNLRDSYVDQQRRAAEAEINAALANVYTTPFQEPVPGIIHTLTIQLAAGLLLQGEYNDSSPRANDLLTAARNKLKSLQAGDDAVTDDDGISTATGGVDSLPDDDAPRAFEMGMRF